MRIEVGPDLAAARAEALARVDAEAELARCRFLTPGAGQAMEYQETRAEAAELLGGGAAWDALVYPFLEAERQAIEATSGYLPPPEAVASLVLASMDAWREVGAEIKRLRRGAKLAVEAATSHAAIRAAADVTWPQPGGGAA